MGECNWRFGGHCEQIATTTLLKSNGVVVQLCEKHRNMLITAAKHIVINKVKTPAGHTEVEANHWLVINEIPF